MERVLVWSRCICVIVYFDSSFKRLHNLYILPLGLEFYAPLTGVLLWSDVFILNHWLMSTWPAGIDAQQFDSFKKIYSYILFLFSVGVH